MDRPLERLIYPLIACRLHSHGLRAWPKPRPVRILADASGRVRDVRQGPDGLLYWLTHEDDGQLVRLVPAN